MKKTTLRLHLTGEQIRVMASAELYYVVGGADIETLCSLRNKDSCYPDPPPRFIEEDRGTTVWNCGPTRGPTI